MLSDDLICIHEGDLANTRTNNNSTVEPRSYVLEKSATRKHTNQENILSNVTKKFGRLNCS